MLTAAQLPGALADTEHAAFKTVLLDADGMPVAPARTRSTGPS